MTLATWVVLRNDAFRLQLGVMPEGSMYGCNLSGTPIAA